MSLNVLVVDDSAVMRSMIVKTLDMTGMELGEIHEASDGQQGLDMLEEHWVDLVLADINMPGMNGQEMIEKIRENPHWEALPIIVVSTEGSETRIEALRQLGAKFIHKPFNPSQIREMIQGMTGVSNEQSI